ncbi:hypothetical protein QJS10_CPA07g00637 [Acorus calamus]|uniref:Protein kinase domain-containing protein n=1 Tax=Acorus calamus TaxID=4465 RepID=A0AAV9EFW6_ACOCL|nr:hypothetical protein QJS10_CPA07g00637 [Acorus calamus]
MKDFSLPRFHSLQTSLPSTSSSSTSVIGLIDAGVTGVLPFVEVDVKKIVSTVIERARELCISKSGNIPREAQTMILVDHPNLLKAHCTFANDHNLWVVMPYMAGGSCLHIMKHAHPNGFEEEAAITTILREVLKGIYSSGREGHGIESDSFRVAKEGNSEQDRK